MTYEVVHAPGHGPNEKLDWFIPGLAGHKRHCENTPCPGFTNRQAVLIATALNADNPELAIESALAEIETLARGMDNWAIASAIQREVTFVRAQLKKLTER